MTELNLAQTLIVGHLWQSVALAGVLAVVLIFGRRMQGATRYSLAGVAFLASLALPLSALVPGEALATAIMEKLGAPKTEAAAPAGPSLVEQAMADSGAPPWALSAGKEALATMAPAGVPASEAPWAKTAIAEGAPAWAIDLGANMLNAAFQPAPPPKPQPLFTLPEFKLPNWNLPDLTLPLVLVWIAGTLILLFRTGRDLLAVERLVARATPANLPEKLHRRMQGVRVVVSPDAPGPMAAGFCRPCIVLPESISLASPGMAALLEHEKAHIERRDMAVALAQRIVLALLWWSPALYWISRRIDEEREVACDEAAVHCTGDAKAFARSLTVQAQNQLWARAPRLAVGAIGPRSQVGRRIKHLIDLAKGASPAKYSGRLAFAGLTLAVAVAAMVTPRFSADAQQTPEESERAIDLLAPESRAEAHGEADADSNSEANAHFNTTLDGGSHDFAALGEEIGRLMETLGPELELTIAGLSPELEAEMAALSVEMAGLGAEISAAVSQEVLQQMPEIMEEVRLALEAEGIALNDWSDFQELSAEDREELRQALEDAREEMRHALGPELQAEIRAALDKARSEIFEHRDEIRAALDEQHAGLEIARHAMAQARAEIDAARARGDFDRLRNIKLEVGRTPATRLMHAVFARDAETVQAVIAAGADPDETSPGGSTPLMHAVMSGDEEIAGLLLAAGADANLAPPGRGGPLFHSVLSGNEDMVRMLLLARADANATAPGSPLFYAVRAGEEDITRLLLNAGADPDSTAPGAAGTALTYAVQAVEEDIVRLLVEKGADVNARSRTGTPLGIAEMSGADEIAAYLRSKGAVANPKPAN